LSYDDSFMRAKATSPGGEFVGEFGDKFRKERERKGISLDDVSNVTKIGSRMLQAIEEEHFDQLPGGVFNKGFIRAYAKHLGLNDEEAVTAYLACLRQAQIDAHEVWEPASPTDRSASSEKRAPVTPKFAPNKIVANKPATKPQAPAAIATKVATQSPNQREELPDLQLPRAEDVRPPRKKYLDQPDREIPWRLLALAALVLVLGIVLWSRHSRSPRTEAASSSPARPAVAPLSTPASVPASTPTPAPVTHTSSARTVNASAANSAAVSASAPSTHSSAPSPQPTPVAQPAITAHSPAAAPATNAAVNPAENPGKSPAQNNPPTASPAPAKPSTPLILIIRASENSWISVLADGQAVSEETLIAPAHTSVRASREIVVKAGNAAGVSFLWNGKEVPAQGAEAEVKTFVFDAAGMRTLPAAPSPAQNQ
jgi:cytoskeletal protein RodZ